MNKLLPALLIALTLVVNANTQAQISYGGTPKSFSSNKSTQQVSVPFKIMKKVDVDALKAEDIHNDKFKDHPWRFGKNLYVDYNPDNSGVWEDLTEGGRLWRLGISSEEALTLNLTFNKYRVPEGAELYIYNTDKTVVLGQFNHKNNQDNGYLASVLIPGESLVIEYYEPNNVAFPGELNIWRVTHGYRGVSDFAKVLGESGDCNVNAACSQGNPISNQIRSVAMLVTGGDGFCTGALVNNTSNDKTPYFLSANHCYGDPSSIVFWFNWQSENCSNPSSSPSYNSISGASTKSRYNMSDFWLLELNETPPLSYNVFYSGWDRSDPSSISTKCWGIHHPSGDIKKISWANNGVTTQPYPDETDDSYGFDHWEIGSWSDNTTTEGGSSGSPLYNTDLRIIGQLHGGSAACGNTFSDYYGKLSDSWTGGGTNDSRLRDWLDQANIGSEYIDGLDPNALSIDAGIAKLGITLTSQLNDTAIIQPNVILHNNGTTILESAQVQYQITGMDPVSINWSGSLDPKHVELINFPSVELAHDTYEATTSVTVSDDEYLDNNTSVTTFAIDSSRVPQLLSANLMNDRDAKLTWTSTDNRVFYDGFESGDFSAWEEVIEGGGTLGNDENNYPYWYIMDNSGLSLQGQYSAYVDWGFLLDTWLVSKPFTLTENAFLKFYWISSYYWHVDPENNGDLFVKISTNGGSTWTQLWTFGNYGVWEDDTWYETILDLNAYTGQEVQIAFHVVADDNDNIGLDEVSVLYLADQTVAKTSAVSIPDSKSYSKAEKGIHPSSKSLKSLHSYYSVYRNGVEVAQVNDTTYTDANLSQGNYFYQIVANYTNPVSTSAASNALEVEVIVTEIKETENTISEIELYPNPSQGLFNVVSNCHYHLTILTMNGMIIDREKIEIGESTVDMTNYDSGIYLLHFMSDDKTFVRKVIIQ